MPEAPSHILIVDDVPRNLQVLALLLDKAGYRVSMAMDGAKALAMVQVEPPDLILLDVMMPELDGLEVCRRLKADPSVREIPVIFLTAKAELEDLQEGFRLGAVDYVTKPFRGGELLARVATHVKLGQALERERELRRSLEATLAQVKVLSGLLPICAKCKKIRDDQGYWNQIENYLCAHADVDFTHGICPECSSALYPEMNG
ncbi:response regulator [Mesoterricola silvestris]|uniref:response regulator n=1 Tax=Mesoterricola silvestris TaxID=2927979 RepID=UPI0029315882|nr:response regulator [Mesoterricola silvestris]